jgi:hypothetical protein
MMVRFVNRRQQI